MLTLDLIVDTEATGIPSEDQFVQFGESALAAANHTDPADICLSIIDSEQSRKLNHEYRSKDKPTNVLSFPADLPESIDIPLLGDILICHSVMRQEAIDQDKSLIAHYAHLTIHGVLHLLGYDHMNDEEATVMEALEIEALNALGFTNPYSSDK
ncbi:MAG: rRNA maturation RNase YbeY [Cellvibrionales bacterium]|nr:rRNA maturation RNase YbeY [Cellvibrionales bacterium]